MHSAVYDTLRLRETKRTEPVSLTSREANTAKIRPLALASDATPGTTSRRWSNLSVSLSSFASLAFLLLARNIRKALYWLGDISQLIPRDIGTSHCSYVSGLRGTARAHELFRCKDLTNLLYFYQQAIPLIRYSLLSSRRLALKWRNSKR